MKVTGRLSAGHVNTPHRMRPDPRRREPESERRRCGFRRRPGVTGGRRIEVEKMQFSEIADAWAAGGFCAILRA
jgi:hypothetical protein